jgi:NAD(P)-dependent dehydrogenase (short-subunit alcohol dehydrogenase family)
MAAPQHADAEKLAKGQALLSAKKDARAVMRVYAASKLCNLLTARALASSALARERDLRVIAFNPGLTPGTGLTRNHGLAFKTVFAVLPPILGLFQRVNTVDGGGALLADMALGGIVPPAGRLYASQINRRLTWPAPSDLARDDGVMAKLWWDSAVLVGLPATE